jgi:hypothetical protein
MFGFHVLPKGTRALQIQALKERYCIVESMETVTEDTVASLAVFPFCLTCKTWKAPVPNPKKLNDHAAHTDLGVQNVAFDGKSGDIFCRACFDDGNMFSFSMLGIIARIGKDAFVLCTGCAAVTYVNPTTTIAGQHLCNACVNELLLAETRADDKSKICVIEDCYYPPPTDFSAPRFPVIDNIDEDGELRTMSLCKHHRKLGMTAMTQTRLRSQISQWVMQEEARRKKRSAEIAKHWEDLEREERSTKMTPKQREIATKIRKMKQPKAKRVVKPKAKATPKRKTPIKKRKSAKKKVKIVDDNDEDSGSECDGDKTLDADFAEIADFANSDGDSDGEWQDLPDD